MAAGDLSESTGPHPSGAAPLHFQQVADQFCTAYQAGAPPESLRATLAGLDEDTELDGWIDTHLPAVLHCLWDTAPFPALSTLTPLFPDALAPRVRGHYVATRAAREPGNQSWSDGFQVLREVGKGAFGTVFHCRDDLGHEFAVKVDQWHIDPRHALDEAQRQARLNSERVIRVHRAGFTTTRRGYVVMEFVAAGTLRDLLGRAQGKPLPVEDAAHYLCELLAGVQEIHQAGLVHNDLKPSNVFVAGDTAKVGDFGGARTWQQIQHDPFDVAERTLPYTAPERWLGAPGTAESDIFSAGAIAYELLTGRRCYDAGNPAALQMLICETPARNPRLDNLLIPVGMARTVLKALHRVPEERYRSATEFADEFAPYRRRAGGQKPPKVSTLRPYPDEFFRQQRPGLLDEIHGELAEYGIVFLSGPPGAGKSFTASVFAEGSDFRYRFWVSAETEESLLLDLAAARRKMLALPAGEKENLPESARAFLDALDETPGWLLIFDNVTDFGLLSKHFPPLRGLVGVLVTTWQDPGTAFAGRAVGRAHLDEFDPETARLFFLHRCDRLPANEGLDAANPTDLKALDALLADLGRLPLALEAAASVCSQGVGIAEYHATFRKSRELWGDKESAGTTATRHPGLAYALRILFEKVRAESPAACELLALCTYLDPDGIPEWMFEQLPPVEGRQLSRDTFVRARAVAKRYRILLEHDEAGAAGPKGTGQQRGAVPAKMLRMHREHQHLFFNSWGDEERRSWFDGATRLLELQGLGGSGWVPAPGLLPNLLRMLRWAEELKVSSADVVRLLDGTGRTQYYHGRYREAVSSFDQALGVLQAEEKEQTMTVAAMMHEKARALVGLGRPAEALPLYDQVLEVNRAALGERHPSYAITLHEKARALVGLGRPTEALPLYDQVLEVKRAALGERHPSYAITLHEKGFTLERLSRFDEALPFYDQAIQAHEAAIPSGHPHQAILRENRAFLLAQLGRVEDAAADRRVAAEIWRRISMAE